MNVIFILLLKEVNVIDTPQKRKDAASIDLCFFGIK